MADDHGGFPPLDDSPARSRSRSPVPAREANNTEETGWKGVLERLYERGDLKRGDLDERNVNDLETMREEESLYVVSRLETSDFSTIRNVNGFVGGIIKRVKTEGISGEATLDSLPAPVKAKIDALIQDNKFESADVDERMIRQLKKLGERDAEEALRRFEESVNDSIRSKQGYMMGILKKMADTGGRGRNDGPSYSRGGGYGGDRDRGYGRDDRYGGGRDSYRGGGDRGYGGDRDRGYGGDRDRGYGGDRDRGYGGDRDRGYGRDRDRGHGGDRDRGYGGDRDRGYGGDRNGSRGGGRYDDRDRRY